MIYFKKYIATEENASEILKKVQKVCNKYYMSRYYSMRNTASGDKPYRQFPCRVINTTKIKNTKRGEMYYRKRRFSGILSAYIRCTEHVYFTKYKNGENAEWDKIPSYSNTPIQPLIHLDLYGGGAMLLNVRDGIRFLPFGIFAISAINDLNFTDRRDKLFDMFIPNLFHRIKDLNLEDIKREKEWYEESKAWDAWVDCENRKFDEDLNDDEYNLDDEFDMRDLID